MARRSGLLALGVLLVALAIGGCSKLQILYNQLDWIVLGFIEERVPLDEAQRERARSDIAGLLAWHCRTQLPDYRDLLGEIAARIETGRVAPEQVAGIAERIEGLFERILAQATPPLARLLSELSPEQVEETMRRAERANAKSERQIRKAAQKGSASDYRETATDQLERWLGPLNASQAQAVDAWSRTVQPLGMDGLAYRRRNQERARELIVQYRGDRTGMEGALRAFIAAMPGLRPPAYRQRIADNKALTYRMVAETLSAIDDTQRRHLREYASNLRGDIAAIRCE